MKVHLKIMLKKSVRDNKSEMISELTNRELNLSHPISNMKLGKYITFNIEEASKEAVESIVKKICDELLVDTISEEYQYTIEE